MRNSALVLHWLPSHLVRIIQHVHVVFSGIRDALPHKDVSVWIELSVFIKWDDDSHCQ